MKKKIGVLLPNSKAYPKLSREFINGLKLGFDEDIDIKIEGIGAGEDPENIKNAIQKLVYQEDVTIITGLLGHKGLGDICEFANNLDQTFIFSDVGASIPLDLSKWSNIFCNSFELNKSIFLMGKVFSEKGIKKVGISTCYNDAGYDINKIIETSINNHKTELSGYFISPLSPRENEATLMANFVKETKPDALFCSHNGIYAKEHASFLKENKITSANIPFYVNPFSIDKEVLKEFPQIFKGTNCVSTWFPSLKNKENVSFLESYQEKYNTEATIFSLLGFENGLLINEKLNGGNINNTQLKGPRGVLSIDEKTSRTTFDHYLWHLDDVDNEYKYIIEKKLENDIGFFNIPPTEGGWDNAYLCY